MPNKLKTVDIWKKPTWGKTAGGGEWEREREKGEGGFRWGSRRTKKQKLKHLEKILGAGSAMPGGVARRSASSGSGVAAAGAAAGAPAAAAAAAPGAGAAVARAAGAVDFHANVRGLSLGDRRELKHGEHRPGVDAVLGGGALTLEKEKLGGWGGGGVN